MPPCYIDTRPCDGSPLYSVKHSLPCLQKQSPKSLLVCSSLTLRHQSLAFFFRKTEHLKCTANSRRLSGDAARRACESSTRAKIVQEGPAHGHAPSLVLEKQFRRRAEGFESERFSAASPAILDLIISVNAEQLSRSLFPKKVNDLARHYSDKLLYLVAPPSLIREEAKDMAVLRWIGNLGRIYGGSLIFLVGFGYWIQGFRCFPWLAVNFYFKDVLSVDPSTLQLVQNTVNLPMVAKPVYGIVSDSVYIRGAHRVPYLAMGGALQALSWVFISILPGGGSSVLIIATFLTLSNLGASMVDVANDALVAECAKKKRSSGELQSFAWFSTAAGGVLGNLIAAFTLSRLDFNLMFGVFGMLLIAQSVKSMKTNEGSFGLKIQRTFVEDVERNADFKHGKRMPVNLSPELLNGCELSSYATTRRAIEPTEYECRPSDGNVVMEEAYMGKICAIRQQLTDLVHLVRQPDILYPLAWFMASYAMIPTLAGTMFYFQTQHLQVDPCIVGLSKVMGQVGLMGGSAIYSKYLKGMPLRNLLVGVQVLLSFCMLSDLLLVKRLNVVVGIPDGALVLGASAFVDALNQFKILPFIVLLGQLCPAGSEGSLLAAFMSLQCLATIISGYMGVTLASVLHISASDFSELPTGVLVQSMAALVPIIWISFIPDSCPKSVTLQPQQREGKST